MNKNLPKNRRENGARLRLFIVKKKQVFIIFLCIATAVALLLGGMKIGGVFASSPADVITVVIDPGHGGIDGGVVGRGGYKESEFNLAMAKDLEKLLSSAGFRVILTRKDDNGLYGEADVNKKRADMAARKEIIRQSDADFVISIHANKFPGDSRRGAQVFFDDMNPAGRELADKIQSELNLLNEKHIGKEFSALSGDYYILKCTHKPSVIVECGFLSNAEDERLLSDEEYRQSLSRAIFAGLSDYSGRE